MIRPIGKNILVQKQKEEKKGILILKPTEGEPYKATVMAIGSKADLDIDIGCTLLLVPYTGSRISTDDDGYLLITERDILGVVA